MVEATCHCGAIRIALETAPSEVTDCNCSICRRYGVLWAYDSPSRVRLTPAEGATDVYLTGDRMIEFHRCKACGCVTHWAPLDKSRDRMGFNARLLPPEILAAARVKHLDGADTWTEWYDT
jgi:hypothetical protein